MKNLLIETGTGMIPEAEVSPFATPTSLHDHVVDLSLSSAPKNRHCERIKRDVDLLNGIVRAIAGLEKKRQNLCISSGSVFVFPARKFRPSFPVLRFSSPVVSPVVKASCVRPW